ncbi:3-hydroxyacyl-CoA dehydrogenase [Usnea florida]
MSISHPCQDDSLRITLIGAGTIGISLVALYLQHAFSQRAARLELTIHDVRPDIEDHVLETLPAYIDVKFTKKADLAGGYDVTLPNLRERTRSCTIIIDGHLESAVAKAAIIQEQGPEDAAFKIALWHKVEQHCSPDALLWSSTSGIPASTQSTKLQDRSRLIVVHPWNPPHIMPLIEVVPSPHTKPGVISQTMEYWKGMGKVPVLLQKETTGFVGNRLAFALLREAIHLVKEGVASVEDIDSVMENSLGPRWAISGPFKSYQAGGGEGGIEAFFKNVGGTVQACWSDSGQVNMGEGWEESLYSQTDDAYGVVDTRGRDAKIRRVLGSARSSGE